ncbi:PRP40 pre-mRNA processing factor 40 [Mortierella alpina]|nr:PRP40 pre-mRNA processing factor 40 [Mortierella alpina]
MADPQLTPAAAPQPPAPAAKSAWTEYTHQDGRKYYYHATTKQTVWQKPDELKTPGERALEACPWKEYSTPEGKKYYHNASTSQTVWTAPDEYKSLMENIAQEIKAAASTATAPGMGASAAAGSNAPSYPQSTKPLTPTSAVSTPSPLRHQAVPPGAQAAAAPQQPPLGRDPASGGSGFMPPQSSRPPYPPHQGHRPPRFQQSFVPSDSNNIRVGERSVNVNETPDFATKEQAEEAFKKLLKDTGVTSTWTWEQTMRAVVTNPMYRALKTTAERKTAFQEYVDERRIVELEEKRARQQKQKQDFLDLLSQHPDKVTHASRYTTVSRLFAEEPVFKAFEDDRERHAIFDGYVNELIRKEKDDARQRRKAGMTALAALLSKIDEITFMTRWAEAREILQEHSDYKESELMQGLAKIDQLIVFEDHLKQLEKEYDQKRVRDRILRKRAERKRREAFKELLGELRSKSELNAKICWMQIYPLIKDDPRYLNMLGQSGSTPMELFWDMIEDLDERLYQDRKMVQDLLKTADFEILPETTLEEFTEVLSKQEKASGISTDDRKLIFEQLLGKAVHYAKEEKRRQEKLARKKAESFRSMLKALEPPVTVESSWEDVKAKAESEPEYAALDNDEKRKEVFDRYIERLKNGRGSKSDAQSEDSGSENEDDHKVKKSKTSKEPADATESMVAVPAAVPTGGEEEGEVVETPGKE